MSRLFAFGCSFTNYHWSTWADCLAPEFDSFENWGQAGAGNHYIFNSVIEANQRHKFGAGDTVIVCWTNWYREVRYFRNKWVALGSMAYGQIYVKEFIDKFINERGCLIRDLPMILSVKLLLESIPNLNWKFLAMCPILREDLWSTEDTNHTDVVELYSDVISSIGTSFQTVLRPLGWGGPYPGWCELNRNGDQHPNPVEHLAYLDAVLPGWVTKQETRAKMLEETELLEQNKYKLENHIPQRSGQSTVQRL